MTDKLREATQLPQGYEPHELPADYTGPLWIEGQMRQFENAVQDRDTALLRQLLDDACSVKLCEFNSMSSRNEMIRLLDKMIAALRERLK